jgi:hypothetical protein
MFGQSDRGRIAGRILDPTGAAVANATIVVENLNTDSKRQTASGEDGRYLVDSLLSANYKVTASAPGFAESVLENLAISAGQQRQFDIHLQPASVRESVTVASGALAEVETSSASIGANVTTREVGNLPLNGRVLAQLYLLVPGASSSGSGQFTELRFSGRANEQNTLRYDGVQAGSILGSSPGDSVGGGATQMRLSQSLENVQEFRVEASTYSAEFGRGTGGQVTVVTKSGGNSFHGGLFEYLRNDQMDARNFFDKGVKPAPLRLNQYGGSFGGRIIKEKLFFFAAQENLNQRVYVPFLQNTFSSTARSLRDCAAGETPSATAPQCMIAAVRPLLAAFPVGNAGPTTNALVDNAAALLSSRVDDHFGSTRLDYHLNDKNNLYLRYNRQQGESVVPTDVGGSTTLTIQTAQNAIIDWTNILSPTMVNDFKVGFNGYKARNITQGVVLPGLDLSDVGISIGGGTASGATGFVTVRGAGSTPISHASPYTAYEWSFIDNLTINRGAHTFKAGFEGNPRGIFMDQIGGVSITFPNVTSFLQNAPNLVSVSNNVSDPSPFHNGAKGVRKGNQYFLGMFFQDEWKLKQNLTMNVGMRYDYFSPLNERDGLAVQVNTDTGALITEGYHFGASKLNFSPRLSFAWSPEKMQGKTVFRIGGGYYYGPGQGEDQWQPILNDLVVVTRSTGQASYPVDRKSIISTFDPNSPTAGYQPRVYATGYQIPEKVLSYTASLQQTLPGQSVLTIAYVGSQGRNLFQRGLANKIVSLGMNATTGAVIVNREFGNRYAELDVKTTQGVNHYNALQVGWNRRFSKGLNASAQYSWSNNIGTSGGSNEASTSENNYSFNQEHGYNSFDMRHVFNMAALYELPIGKGRAMALKSKALDYVLGGWNVGGNYNFHTALPINVLMTRTDTTYFNPNTGQYVTAPVLSGGVPVTIPVLNIPGGGQSRGTQRPDVIAGCSPSLDKSTGFALDPSCFTVPKPGTYGNVARNFARGLNFGQLDMTVAKTFAFTERIKTELRGEIYNITNHPNFANPSANLGTGGQPGSAFSRSTSPAFGQLNSTVGRYVNNGTNRQMQVSLRLTF